MAIIRPQDDKAAVVITTSNNSGSTTVIIMVAVGSGSRDEIVPSALAFGPLKQ